MLVTTATDARGARAGEHDGASAAIKRVVWARNHEALDVDAPLLSAAGVHAYLSAEYERLTAPVHASDAGRRALIARHFYLVPAEDIRAKRAEESAEVRVRDQRSSATERVRRF